MKEKVGSGENGDDVRDMDLCLCGHKSNKDVCGTCEGVGNEINSRRERLKE